VIDSEVKAAGKTEEDLCFLLLTSYGHQLPKKETPKVRGG
jgi:hypothetical protein